MGRLSTQAVQALQAVIRTNGLAGNPWDIAAQINAKTIPVTVQNTVVPRSRIKQYLVTSGLLMGIMNDQSKSSAALARILFSDPDYTTVDLSDPAFQYLAQSLMQDGFVTQADINNVNGLGNQVVKVSLLDQNPQIGVPAVTSDDVTQALGN